MDAKITVSDGTDALRGDLVLCRNFGDAGKGGGRKGYDGAGALFTEECELCWNAENLRG